MKMVLFKETKKAAAVLLAFLLIFLAVNGIPEQAAGIDPSLIKAGDFVCFGRYPQSSLGTAYPTTGTENIDWVTTPDAQNKDTLTYYAIEPIIWRVFENSDGELFLLSENIIDNKPYNSTLPSVAWKNCSIRKWLNDTTESDSFVNKAFSPAEKAAINHAADPNGNNPGYATEDGNDTTDQFFFLSFDEIGSYFTNDTDRISYNTPYSASINYYNVGYWWLRTPPGGLPGYAAYVSDYGTVYSGGHHVFYILGVRPALRLNLSSVIFTSGDGTLISPYSVDTVSVQNSLDDIL